MPYTWTKVRSRFTRVGALLALAVLALPGAGRADVISDWYRLTL